MSVSQLNENDWGINQRRKTLRRKKCDSSVVFFAWVCVYMSDLVVYELFLCRQTSALVSRVASTGRKAGAQSKEEET